ncbi:MAG: lasso peptide biosynthesis PqqD family chaperone [Anaerolineae bacterium]|nr:lasso peptide biosynthesis PqqD family chaperone [Anaerolineae bacterium]
MLHSTRVMATNQQVAADMMGEAVILNTDSGIYFGLNGVGTRIWELVQQPITVQAVQQTILDEYEVDAERCEQDVHRLLGKLLDAGLVEVVNAESR